MSHDGATPQTGDGFALARERMVREQLAARGIQDAATLAAMGAVPRESFVPADQRDRAYEDGALSIGSGQTISQPYIVARMTEALDVSVSGWPWRTERPSFLDVGTGSGYQAAILAQLGARVTSLERDAVLAADAQRRLESLGYEVSIVVGDGSEGYAPNAPYTGIVVAAAAPRIPSPLVDQLAEGGRLIIPIGPRDRQWLTTVRRSRDQVETRTLDACVFVPLVGRHGYHG